MCSGVEGWADGRAGGRSSGRSVGPCKQLKRKSGIHSHAHIDTTIQIGDTIQHLLAVLMLAQGPPDSNGTTMPIVLLIVTQRK